MRRAQTAARRAMVEGGGFEPPKAEPSDLQSDPFDRSGTPPSNRARQYRRRYTQGQQKSINAREPQIGFDTKSGNGTLQVDVVEFAAVFSAPEASDDQASALPAPDSSPCRFRLPERPEAQKLERRIPDHVCVRARRRRDRSFRGAPSSSANSERYESRWTSQSSVAGMSVW